MLIGGIFDSFVSLRGYRGGAGFQRSGGRFAAGLRSGLIKIFRRGFIYLRGPREDSPRDREYAFDPWAPDLFRLE